MTKIQCSRQSCRKVFEKPILVTNFVFTPTKETYQACPYCLARIDDEAITCDCAVIGESVIEAKEETKKTCSNSDLTSKANFEKIGELEKTKKELLAQLNNLKNGATKKICRLEQEIAALKEEKQILEQITN